MVEGAGLGAEREFGWWVERAVEYVRTHPRKAKWSRRREAV